MEINWKKFLGVAKEKEIDVSDLLEETQKAPTEPKIVTNDNSAIIAELRASTEQKAKEIETLKQQLKDFETLKKQFEDFQGENLKKEEERAAKEKAYQEEQEKIRSEKIKKDRESIIANAVKDGKIAPKDEKTIARLNSLDPETIQDIIDAFPAVTKAPEVKPKKSIQLNDTYKPNVSVSEYLKDIQIK